MTTTFEQHIDHVNTKLKEAQQVGMTTEVVLTALIIMKDKPDTSISAAMDMACEEWDVTMVDSRS